MFAQDHWFLDKTTLSRTNSEEEHWDHHAVGSTMNLQTHASDATSHFGSSVHIYELDKDDESDHHEGTTSPSKSAPTHPTAAINHQTHTSDAMNHVGSSVRSYELEDAHEEAHEYASALWNFPWWRIGPTEDATENYLAKTRMKDREGEALLIDPGSPDNLCGDEWSERMRTAAVRAGRPDTTSIPMRNQLEVGGIGTGTQTATQKVVHRIGLAGGREANYKTPVLPNSGTPALLGQRSLRKMRALIDCFTGRLYFIGPEDYQIKVSPGSETHELVESHAGHLMLPCSEFQDNSKATKEAMQVMNAHITKDGGAPPVSTNAGGVPKPRP
jgi:hypothetical protein